MREYTELQAYIAPLVVLLLLLFVDFTGVFIRTVLILIGTPALINAPPPDFFPEIIYSDIVTSVFSISFRKEMNSCLLLGMVMLL